MSGPYQGRDLSNCSVVRLRVAINCGVLSVKQAMLSNAVYIFYTGSIILLLIYLGGIIGRAKQAPHWGVQSRFHVIYICVGMSVVCQTNYVGGITWPLRMLKVIFGR